MRGVERIEAAPSCDGSEGLIALVIRAETSSDGTNFYTNPSDIQQVAVLKHPKGIVIPAHKHNRICRVIQGTPETLVIRKGILHATFYSSDGLFADDRFLGPGDVLIILSGGHKFIVLEDCDVVEVKQGPYLGVLDKEYLK